RFWAHLPHTFATIKAGMTAAREAGLTEVFATLWADDGAECDLLSALPGLEFLAAECFGTPSEDQPVRFQGSVQANWQAWCAASALDHLPKADLYSGEAGSLAKLLLWHDPLLGFLEC